MADEAEHILSLREADDILEGVRQTAFRFGAAFFFLCASPCYLAGLLSAARSFSTNRVLAAGIAVLILLAAVGVLFFCFGSKRLSTFQRAAANELIFSRQAAEYYDCMASRWRSALAPACVLGGVLDFGGIFLLLREAPGSERSFFLSFAAFLLFGIGDAVILSAALRARLPAAVRFRRSEAEDGGPVFDRKRELRGAMRGSCVYWAAVLCVYAATSIFFESWRLFLSIPGLALLRYLLCILVSNPFASYASLRRKRPGVIALRAVMTLCVAAAALAVMLLGSWQLMPRILETTPAEKSTCEIRYDQDTGVYTLKCSKSGGLRILQLTDIHLAGSVTTGSQDQKALDACEKLIREAQPDLVIVTGDLVYPLPVQTFTINNLTPAVQFCYFMRQLGVPWAFVYGNHDTEQRAAFGAAFLNGTFDAFSYEKGANMLFSPVQPEIYGRYNQYLRIEKSDGSLSRLIFLMDSNDYASKKRNDYDSIHADQVLWYRQTVEAVSKAEGRTVPSFLFCHIPFKAYDDAYKALQDGSPDAELLFGKNGESVGYSLHENGIFDAILAEKSTDAVFAGHDHINNSGIRYKGVALIYGMSIDYLAYPGIASKTAQRGGTLVTLSGDAFTIRQIPLSELN